MTTLAYKVDDAISLLSGFDDTGTVTQEQILEIAADLDSWDQAADGVIELQGGGQETRAKLAAIIRDRTGLTYQQASKFYDKAEQAFLDRRIPALPGEGSTGDAGAVGALALAAAVPVSAEALESVTGKNDYFALGRLLDDVKTAEKYWAARTPLPTFDRSGPLPSFDDPKYKLQECRALREVLTALRSEVETTGEHLKTVGDRSKEALGDRRLGDTMKVMAHRRTMLREMIAHYGRSNEVRPGDVNTLRVYLEAAKKTNLHLTHVSRALTTAVSTSRVLAAGTPQILQAVRGVGSLANGLRQLIAPARAWINQSSAVRGFAPAAAAAAGLGLIYFVADAASGLGDKPEKEIEFVKPENKKADLPSAPKSTDASPAGTVSIDSLPEETVSIDQLPMAASPVRGPRAFVAKKK